MASYAETVSVKAIAQKLLKQGRKDLKIAVIGLQQSGKTTLIESLCSKKELHEEIHRPAEEAVCINAGNMYGINMKFIDTPGLGGLKLKPTTVFREMFNAVNISEGGNSDVDLILFCIRVDGRLQKELNDTFSAMAEEFPNVWKNVVVVLTHTDVQNENTSEQEVTSLIRDALKPFGGEAVPFISGTSAHNPTDAWLNSFWKKCLQQINKSSGPLQCNAPPLVSCHDPKPQYCGGYTDEGVNADLILRYEQEENEQRETFMESCRNMALKVEDNKHSHQIEILATEDVLKEGAEKMRMKLPFKDVKHSEGDWCDRLWNRCKFSRCDQNVPENLQVNHSFTAVYDRSREFPNVKFTSSQRSAIVWHLLQGARYGENEDQVGIQQLLSDGVFVEVFVPHENDTVADIELSSLSSDYICGVQDLKSSRSDYDLLCKHYGQSFCRMFWKRQPLGQMRRYFGEKVSFYFAWLGFYTFWLILASIFGGLITVVGISAAFDSAWSFIGIVSDACNRSRYYDFYMCPACDGQCDFWYLTDYCSLSRLAQVFDNKGTIIMASFMSIWAILFLEFWKRQQFSLQFLWDLIDHEEPIEPARPEFEKKIKKLCKKKACTDHGSHPVFDADDSSCDSTETTELLQEDSVRVKNQGCSWKCHGAYVLRSSYNPKPEYVLPECSLRPMIVTILVILTTLCTAGSAIVIAVGIYLLRSEVANSILKFFSTRPSEGDIVVLVLAAILQLVLIFFLSKFYRMCAKQLTNQEYHRTDKEYETSYSIKASLFEFFNYYSSLFYVAFIKANVAGHPGEYSRIGGLRLQECPTYGCMFELTIQFVTIMMGLELLHFIQYIFCHCRKKLLSKCCLRRCTTSKERRPYDHSIIFTGNLDLVLQYGFITIFVAAFPLAPLIALVRNCVKIRYDADQLLNKMNRPVPQRVLDVGVWFYIIKVISQIAVLTNGLLISFTSQFIPHIVYQHAEARHDTSGYLEWSHNSFKVSNLLDGRAFPAFTSQNLHIHGQNSTLLYLPFINFSCLEQQFPELIPYVEKVPRQDSEDILCGITKDNYRDHIYSNNTIRDFILKPNNDDPSRSPIRDSAGECFNGNITCRYRGFIMDASDESTFRAEYIQMNKYWHILAIKLATALIFENIVFLVGMLVAFLLPDVQQSIKNDILHGKLEAYHFYNSRESESSRCETQCESVY